MGRTTRCGKCGATLDVSAFAPGQNLRCGGCQQILVVPAEEPEMAPVGPRGARLPGPARQPPPVPAGPRSRAPVARSRRAGGSVPNLMPWAILATLLCCQIGGIIAIVLSSQATAHARRGDMRAARAAEKHARTWLLISFLTPPVLLVAALATGYFSRHF